MSGLVPDERAAGSVYTQDDDDGTPMLRLYADATRGPLCSSVNSHLQPCIKKSSIEAAKLANTIAASTPMSVISELVHKMMKSMWSSGHVTAELRHLPLLNAGVVGPYEDLLYPAA